MRIRTIALAFALVSAPGAAVANDCDSPFGILGGVADTVGEWLGTLGEIVRTALPGHERPKDPPCAAASAGGRRGTRALSYNVKAGRDSSLETIARDIRAMDADFVALQEVDVGVRRTGEVDQAARLAETTGLEFHAFAKAIDHDGGAYGVAILSRFPLEDVRSIPLPGGGERRTVLCATVKKPDGDVRVCSTHLGLDAKYRDEQVPALLAFLESAGEEKVVLMGDFNDVPGSPTLRAFERAGFRDAFADAGGGDGFTAPSTAPRRRIDFVLTKGFGEATCAEVPRTTGSDHRPVIAVLP